MATLAQGDRDRDGLILKKALYILAAYLRSLLNADCQLPLYTLLHDLYELNLLHRVRERSMG